MFPQWAFPTTKTPLHSRRAAGFRRRPLIGLGGLGKFIESTIFIVEGLFLLSMDLCALAAQFVRCALITLLLQVSSISWSDRGVSGSGGTP